jgi:hypothetical protein
MILGIFLLSIALAVLLIASIPTTGEILRLGNDADPLRREIEQKAPPSSERPPPRPSLHISGTAQHSLKRNQGLDT